MPRCAPPRRSGAARDDLVLRNRGIVYMIARRTMRLAFVRRAFTLEDAVQVGFATACHAAEIWDETRGLTFGAYLGRAVWNNILRYAAEQGLIGVPLMCVHEAYRSGREMPGGDNNYGGRGDLHERARAASHPISVDALVGMAIRQRGYAGPAADADRREQIELVRAALRYLPGHWRMVVIRRYGLDGRPPAKLREIAADLGLTRARIQQIEVKAFERLRRTPELRMIQGRATV